MTTEERLASLERVIELHTDKLSAIQPDGKTIQAEKFELVDSRGRVRASLTTHDNGTVLGLFDENGTDRARLTADNKGTALFLYDENGTTRAYLGVVDSRPGLSLRDENGTTRALLGEAGLGLFDKNERIIWSAP